MMENAADQEAQAGSIHWEEPAVTQHSCAHIKEEPFSWEVADYGWRTLPCRAQAACSLPDIKEEPRPCRLTGCSTAVTQLSPDPGEEERHDLPAERRGNVQEKKLSSAPIGQIPVREDTELPYLKENSGQSAEAAASNTQCSQHQETRPAEFPAAGLCPATDIKEEPLSERNTQQTSIPPSRDHIKGQPCWYTPEQFSSTEGHPSLYIKEELGVLETGRVNAHPGRKAASPLWWDDDAPYLFPVRPCGEDGMYTPPYREEELIVGRDEKLAGVAPSEPRSPASHSAEEAGSPPPLSKEEEEDSLTDVDSFIHPDETTAASPLWWDEDGFRDCTKIKEEPHLHGADGPAGVSIAHKAAAKKPFSCPSCGKCYLRQEQYETHSKTHLREKPYACSQCEKSFNIRTSLLRHQSVHTGVKPHPCTQCDKAFKTRSGLVHHQRSHTGEKLQYKCEQCGKIFSTRSGYTYHCSTHTADKPYQCGQCGKHFANNTMCARHQQVHTDKPHSCPDCGRCFSHKSNLRVHLRCHTGEKPFTCPECGKSFTAKGTLNQHLRIHTGEKPYCCPTCGKGFKQQWSLTQHTRTHH